MRVAQVLSLLYFIATSTGFAPDNQRTSRDLRTKSVFRRESNNANNNKLVYFSTTLFHAAFIKPMGGADASDVVVETKRKKKVIASSSKALSSVEGLVSKSRQTLSKTTKPVMVKSDETKLSRTSNLEGDARQWNIRFQQLVEYKQQHGDCMVPQQFRENPQLGKWVCKQRQLYKKVPKEISDDHIQRLEDVGFVWDVRDAQWELRFAELVDYKQQHGDYLVPSLFQENPVLGKWVNTQRHFCNQVPKRISDERIQRLDDIGFVWDARQAEWESRYKELLEYKQQHGDCLVPNQFQENPQLGRWVWNQRKCYKSDPITISHDRIQRLENVGFEWDVFGAQWELRFKELLEYKEQYGDCLVPSQSRKFPELGHWVCEQRQLYKQVPTLLSEDYTQRLNDIGFAWVGRYLRWEEGFEALLEYKEQYGDCLVPRWFRENPPLARWVRDQRKCYKSKPKQIMGIRIRRLEYNGFVWDVKDAK